MAALDLVSFPAFLFEDEHLVAFNVAQHGGRHGCAVYRRRADLDRVAVGQQQHAVEGERVVGLGIMEVGDVERFVLAYLILFAFDLYNSVHPGSSALERRVGYRRESAWIVV